VTVIDVSCAVAEKAAALKSARIAAGSGEWTRLACMVVMNNDEVIRDLVRNTEDRH